MGQRLSRAKAKITAARIPFAIPDPEHWPDRLQSVLTVIYLIFTRGYAVGPARGLTLCEEALFLARLLNDLSPNDAEIEGALSLILITHARAGARVQGGQIVLLAAQDRTQWNHALLDEGRTLVAAALARRNLGPFQLKAAIAACHVAEGAPDWPQIAALYAVLLQFEDTPVVRLSQAVALAETRGVVAGLAALEPLEADLGSYGPYHATRADFLARSGDKIAAQAAYDCAIEMCDSAEDAAYLQSRRDDLNADPPKS
jgi:RNA polymerase sigma-70 factor (ECF subfamily)